MTVGQALGVAPMVDCTNRHDRHLLRLMSSRDPGVGDGFP